ncbi:hypothetical protein O3Q51_06750 [Cryomorphaceae bacterium 1068]|nr:hypothetical protein [Cryomorphaceae bacterium 1068]
MKKLLAILFLLNLTVSAQTIFEKSWNSPYSLTVSDVATDGMSNSYFACSGNNMFIDSTMSVVVKVNADFEVAWANWYRTLRRDDLGSIEVLADGNILLGGTMRQEFAFDVGGGLIKIDPDGAVIWQKMYNGSFDERIFTHQKWLQAILSL